MDRYEVEAAIWIAMKHDVARAILETALAKPAVNAGEIIQKTKIPKGTVRYHFKKMESLGILKALTYSTNFYYLTRGAREVLEAVKGKSELQGSPTLKQTRRSKSQVSEK